MLKAIKTKMKNKSFKRFFKFKLKKKLTKSNETLIKTVSELINDNVLKVKDKTSNISLSREPIRQQEAITESMLINPLFNDLTNCLIRNLNKKELFEKEISIYNLEFNQINEDQLVVTYTLPISFLKNYHKDAINILRIKQNSQIHHFPKKIKNEMINKKGKSINKHSPKKSKTKKHSVPNEIFVEKRLSSIPIDEDFITASNQNLIKKNLFSQICNKANKLIVLSLLSTVVNPIFGE